MKKPVLIIFILLVTDSAASRAQTLQGGTCEASLSVSFGSASLVGNATTPLVRVSVVGKPVSYFSSFIRVGYFFTRAIEAEAELHWFTLSGNSPVGIYTLNALWNIPIRESRFVPFFLFGGGYANGLPPLITGATGNRLPDCTVVNVGAGLKYLATEHFALRTEYRFQQLNRVDVVTENSSTYVSTLTLNNESLLVGFSVLF